MVLQRTLEPEVMDSPQDAAHYDQVNHGFVNDAFVNDLIALLQTDARWRGRLKDGAANSINVLDVGTANALIPVQLCQQQPTMRIVAIDMSPRMLDVAAKHVAQSPWSDRIELAKVDAKAMSFDSNTFDIVVCKSTIHHFPSPIECLAEIVRVLKPGGAVFIRDLMRPSDQQTLETIAQTYVGSESLYAQQQYRESLHAALTLEEIRSTVSILDWDSNQVVATSDRHWTWAALESSGL